MPLNSTLFIFGFAPAVLLGFIALSSRGEGRARIAWLIGASLLFYAWAQPTLVFLLIASVAVNFACGLAIQRATRPAMGRLALGIGIALDLGLLGWFKYAHFAADSFAALTGQDLDLDAITLPLAISFFTFQQIGYLLDTWEGRIAETRLLHYVLFIAFFPKLIAGPIVHHREMMDQVDAWSGGQRVNPTDLAVGISLFAMGLFKKVVLADGIAADCAAAGGLPLSAANAWIAAFGYTFQVYFDFSGYSDMALGAARCFGIVLPINFFSPLKASNISEFWRRWHVTLTRFLRAYLFVPISRGIMRRAGPRWDGAAIVAAQMVTMTLCGLWHGAGWSFVVWGALHGVLLLLHDGWLAVKLRLGLEGTLPPAIGEALGRAVLLTVLAATFVIFRAADLDTAAWKLSVMAGLTDSAAARTVASAVAPLALAKLGLLLAIVWGLPNSLELLAAYRPALDLLHYRPRTLPPFARWRPDLRWAGVMLMFFLPALYALLTEGHAEFIYRFF